MSTISTVFNTNTHNECTVQGHILKYNSVIVQEVCHSLGIDNCYDADKYLCRISYNSHGLTLF